MPFVRALLAVLPAATCLAQTPRALYSTYTFNPLEHLSGIAPYFEPQDPPRDPSPPQGCQVEKAAYLVRHAAINANDFDYETYLEPFAQKLQNTSVDWARIPGLNFLATWSPPREDEQEQLTRTGKLEAAQLGVELSYRYNNLRLPKRVWASTAERTVVSAQGFIRGIELDDNEIELLQIYEGKKSGADSLTPYSSCTRYSSSYGSKQSTQYVDIYTTPIIARLKALAPAFNWTSNDVVAMFEWCGYDTVVRGQSPFCSADLFRPDEWLSFEYGQDIMYHYNTGYGNEYSGAIGMPWVQASIDLLTGTSTTSNSTSNSTSNDDQDIYVSFTHRELPPTVLVALGLFNNSEYGTEETINSTMPLDRINTNRRWRSSSILPFLTNVAIERMNCSASYGFNVSSSGGDSTFYRVLVNRSPQSLPGCADGPAESCSAAGLTSFLQGRKEVVGNYGEVCQVDYSNSTDVASFYSQQTNGTVVGRRGMGLGSMKFGRMG